MAAVRSLGKRFNDLVSHQETLPDPDEEKPPLNPLLQNLLRIHLRGLIDQGSRIDPFGESKTTCRKQYRIQ